MTLRSQVSSIFVILAGLVAVFLIVGSVLGQPILLSYVETESMSPTLKPGDGFVAVPAQLDGSIQEGDVIVFQAEEIQAGGLTTHRVVDKTDSGYITKGDANPFTDQDNDEPPVKRAQVVAKALQINGRVVVIPHLGTVVEGTKSVLVTIQGQVAGLLGTRSFLSGHGLAYLFFAVTVSWYAVGEIRGRNSKRRQRVTSRVNGIDARLVVSAFAVLLVVAGTAAMVAPVGTQEYEIVSANFESERPDVIPRGESNTVPYLVDNGGFLPVVSFLEPASEGVEIEPQETVVPARTAVNASVTLYAPPETGYYRRYVTEHRYLALLPQSTIRGLYEYHPWAPIVVIDAVITVPFYLLGVRLVGRARIRRDRSRESSQSIVTRVRGFVTDLY